MIRRVTTVDAEADNAIASLGAIFYEQAGLPGKFNGDVFIGFWKKCVESGIAAQWVFEQDSAIVGTIGMLIIVSPFDGKIVAEETFWFVHPDHRGTAGLRLFMEAEMWAKAINCDAMKVGYLTNLSAEKLHAFYERRGYRALQTQFVKQL